MVRSVALLGLALAVFWVPPASAGNYEIDSRQVTEAIAIVKAAPRPEGFKDGDREIFGSVIAIPSKRMRDNGEDATLAQVRSFNYANGLAALWTVDIDKKSLISVEVSKYLVVPLDAGEIKAVEELVLSNGSLKERYGASLSQFTLEFLPERPEVGAEAKVGRLVRVLLRDGDRYAPRHPSIVADLAAGQLTVK